MDIIRSIIGYSAVYQVVTIDGLNVLHQNEEDGAELTGMTYEPYREFIGELLSTLSGSVLFGCYMTIDVLDDLITKHQVHDLFEPVLMSVQQEEFFAVRPVTRSRTGEHVVVEQSYFCSDIHRFLTDERLRQQHAWRFVFEGLLYDSIAIFLSKNEVDTQAMRELLDSRSQTDEFIVRALALYDYILVSSYDGYHVELFTKVNCDTTDIERACTHTARYISSLPWFIANKDGLKWDVDTGCLRLKNPNTGILGAATPTSVVRESRILSQPSKPLIDRKFKPQAFDKSRLMRVETVVDGSYKETTVYGLNILRHNLKPSITYDELAFQPYRVFLAVLLSELRGTAILFSDEARNWTTEFISARHLDNFCQPTRLSSWRGNFSYKPEFSKAKASATQELAWPCAISIADGMIGGISVSSNDVYTLLLQNLVDSGVALFLNRRDVAVPDFTDLDAVIHRNLQRSGLKHRQFVESALALFEYIIILDSDGRILSAMTNLECNMDVIQRAVDHSADYIASTRWLDQNAASLHWVEMYGCWTSK